MHSQQQIFTHHGHNLIHYSGRELKNMSFCCTCKIGNAEERTKRRQKTAHIFEIRASSSLRYLMSHEIGSGTGWRYLLHSEEPCDAQKSHCGFSVSIIFFCVIFRISTIILHNILLCNIKNIRNIFAQYSFAHCHL